MKRVILHSLKTRLIAGAVLWISLGALLAGFSISALFREHVVELVDAELSGHLVELISLLEVKEGRVGIHRRLSDPRFQQQGTGFYWQVSQAGKVVLTSPSVVEHLLPVTRNPPAAGMTRRQVLASAHGEVIVYDRTVSLAGAPPVRVQIGADLLFVDGVLAHFNRALVISLGLLALALVAAAVLQVAFGLQPMNSLRRALAAIKSGQATRLPRSFPAEVQPLVDDLNGLIDANAQMVARARAQAGNLAHGLKTPLAVLVDEAHRLSTRGADEAAQVIIQQCQRMQRQIDYQIARARAAASRSVPGVVAPVDATVQAIVSALKRLYSERGIAFTIDVAPDSRVVCDPLDLNEILANLIDNACKWATRAVAVQATLDPDGAHVIIHVDDDGPGLPPEAVEVVFQIGERLDERVPGAGLGLSIVRDLVQLYGGEIHLAASPLGGLRAGVRLPAPRPSPDMS